MNSSELTAEEQQRCDELFQMMPPVPGEIRRVNRCADCHKLFGHRFVPYGLGTGLLVGVCLCQLTANRPFQEVQQRDP